MTKRKKWCFCGKLSVGIRVINLYGMLVTTIQLLWIVYRLFGDENSQERDGFSRIVSCRYSYLGFGYDVLCNFFKGQINMFTLSFGIVTVICGGTASVCGIYAWMKGFPFHDTERYFYIHFIVTIFYVINFIMVQIVLTEYPVVSIIAALVSAYLILGLNNLIWCFLCEVELKYRRHRETQARHIIVNETK
ncbi:unnamed protein product [Moneuplotes crassus]|uniref:Uncharacterized protein n=1 Tax=Euplotes crassus TaxID=5936 RepID=A0AAD1Y1A1_EUPCR|nr:unnamed protein product [Moneuplotes crassus]